MKSALSATVLTTALVGVLAFGLAQSSRAVPMSGLELWLQADAITGLNDGDPVATWTGSTPVTNNATQGIPANQPTYQSGAGDLLNGKPVVRFDGAGAGNGDWMQFTGVAARQVFVISKAAANNSVLILGSTVFNHQYGTWWTGLAASYLNFDGAYNFSGNTAAGSLVTWTLREYTYDGATYAWYDNGNSLGTDPSGVQMILNEVGGLFGAGNVYNGDYAEILIYNRLLTAGEQRQVGYYLETKYGLDTTYIPEPASALLVALAGLLGLRRRR